MPPDFWWQTDKISIASRILGPGAMFVSQAGRYRRKFARPTRVEVPVICVGNATVGGAGKTPVTLELARRLKDRGKNPHILSRGYKARHKAALTVDPQRHASRDVGDEPLMMAHYFPCHIGSDRRVTARLAIDQGADILIMDDGYQNPFLFQDKKLLVIDEARPFGNGLVFPAGPLREPLEDCLSRADALLLVSSSPPHPSPAHSSPAQEADKKWLADLLRERTAPLYRLRFIPKEGPPRSTAPPGKWIAFAGIGHPEKFFASAQASGYNLVAMRSFPDHHFFSSGDIKRLSALAQSLDARLLTTEKDYMRLKDFPASGVTEALAVLKIKIAWQTPVDGLIDMVLS